MFACWFLRCYLWESSRFISWCETKQGLYSEGITAIYHLPEKLWNGHIFQCSRTYMLKRPTLQKLFSPNPESLLPFLLSTLDNIEKEITLLTILCSGFLLPFRFFSFFVIVVVRSRYLWILLAWTHLSQSPSATFTRVFQTHYLVHNLMHIYPFMKHHQRFYLFRFENLEFCWSIQKSKLRRD